MRWGEWKSLPVSDDQLDGEWYNLKENVSNIKKYISILRLANASPFAKPTKFHKVYFSKSLNIFILVD